MVRVHTTISLEDDILDKAKQANLNVSGLTDWAIKQKLSMKEIVIKDRCEFCGREERKASEETGYVGLIWMCPDEKWVCTSCFSRFKAGVAVAAR